MHLSKYFCLLLFPMITANAGELDIHGYGTVGAVHAIDAGAEYIRDQGQPKGVAKGETSANIDSRFGLQLDYLYNQDLSFTVQVLSKYQADATFAPEIAWAFAKYTVLPGLQLRVGRTKLDFLFQADEVNLGFPSLTVRPPNDFYSLPLRTSDGFDLDYTIPYRHGYLTSSVNFGVGTNDKIPIVDTTYDNENSPIIGGSVNYEAMDWSLKISYGRMKPTTEPSPIAELITQFRPFSQELADSLSLKDKWGSYYSVGGTWNPGNWSSVFALGAFRTTSMAFPSANLRLFKLGYRINQLTPYVALSSVKSLIDPIKLNSGTVVDVIADQAQQYFQTDQKTYSVGARYDLTSNIALKAQYDLIDNDTDKTSNILNEEDGWDGTIKLLTLALDYYF